MGREADVCVDTGIWECVDTCRECKNAKGSKPDLMLWHANGHLEDTRWEKHEGEVVE